jgi:flagellar biosynthesis protein
MEQSKAAALQYPGDVPRVIAAGRGRIAEKIITLAQEHNIPLVKDAPLMESLELLTIGQEIPEELYKPVAVILASLYSLDKEYQV